jgi:hypothetical protein
MTKKKHNGPHPTTLTYDGRTITYKEWAAENGWNHELIRYRDKVLHWSVEKILTTPPMDVTKPKVPRSLREPPPPKVPPEVRRADCVAGILGRMAEPGYIGTVEIELFKAWDDGHGATP